MQKGDDFEEAANQHIYFAITVTDGTLSGNLALPHTLSGVEFYSRNNFEETPDAHRDIFIPFANVPSQIDNNGFYVTRERVTSENRSFFGEVLPNGTVTITPLQHDTGPSSTHYLIMMASDNFCTTDLPSGLNEADGTSILTLDTAMPATGDTVTIANCPASVTIEGNTCHLSWTMASFGLNAGQTRTLVSEGADSAGRTTLTTVDRPRRPGDFPTGGQGTCISGRWVSISLEVYGDSADMQMPQRLTMIIQES